jgi:hypothetical protein
MALSSALWPRKMASSFTSSPTCFLSSPTLQLHAASPSGAFWKLSSSNLTKITLFNPFLGANFRETLWPCLSSLCRSLYWFRAFPCITMQAGRETHHNRLVVSLNQWI